MHFGNSSIRHSALIGDAVRGGKYARVHRDIDRFARGGSVSDSDLILLLPSLGANGDPFVVTLRSLFHLATTLPTEVLIRWAPGHLSRPHTPPNPFSPATSPHRLNASLEGTRWLTGSTLPRCLVSTFLWLTSVFGVRLADLLACLSPRHRRGILQCPHRPHPRDASETR